MPIPLKSVVKILAAGLVSLSISCTQVLTSEPELPKYDLPGLTVSGNHLTTSTSAVELRGVTVEEFSSLKDRDCERLFLTLKEDWNANAVRIMVNPGTWQEEERQSQIFAARIKGIVSVAVARGLFVVLDYHALGWPDGYATPLDWPNPTNSQLATRFWTLMAQTLQDQRVIFELWNEPQRDPRASTSSASDWAQLKANYQDWISTIRAEGNNNVILAGGLNSASRLIEVAADPLTGTNIGYSWHIYPSEDLGSGTGGNYTTWKRDLAELPTTAPVVITEWGFDPTVSRGVGKDELVGTSERFGAFFRDRIIDSIGLSAISWGFADYQYGSVFSDQALTRLTDYGQFVRTFLARSYTSAFNNQVKVSTSLPSLGNLYLFGFPSASVAGGYWKLYDGTTTNQASFVDGYYLINYSVPSGTSVFWANSLGMNFQLGGVTLDRRMKNPNGDEMLAFRQINGRIINGWQ